VRSIQGAAWLEILDVSVISPLFHGVIFSKGGCRSVSGRMSSPGGSGCRSLIFSNSIDIQGSITPSELCQLVDFSVSPEERTSLTLEHLGHQLHRAHRARVRLN
jgi:hypothetical protein